MNGTLLAIDSLTNHTTSTAIITGVTEAFIGIA